MVSKVSEKGQITIPKPLRESLGIEAGEEMAFEERDGTIVVRRTGRSTPIRRLVGLVRERVDVDAYLADARGPSWTADLDEGDR
jgi:AbrB family looped-hinge helix DNA binding protein